MEPSHKILRTSLKGPGQNSRRSDVLHKPIIGMRCPVTDHSL